MGKVEHDSEKPAHGQQVMSAVAVIHRERDGVREIFMPKRAETKKFLPGVFELPGGHVDYGENPVDGLKREILEELGVRVAIGDLLGVFDYTNEVKGSHSFELVYFATLLDDESKITLEPEDHSEYIWVREDTIERAYTDAKGADDVEIQNVMRAFELLNGATLDFEGAA